MLQKQISVFVENKKGRLAEVTKTLGENGIDMRALSIADTTDFGVLRIIVDKPDEAEKVLRDNGFTVSISDVIAMTVGNKPGGLAESLAILDQMDINIEYLYAFLGRSADMAIVIVRVENPDDAIGKIKSSPIHLLTKDELNIL